LEKAMAPFANAFSDKPKTRQARNGKVVSFHLDTQLADELENFCSKENISKSYFVRESLRLGFKAFKTKGYVYFIKLIGTNKVKIGRSKNPIKRIDQELKVNLPFDLEKIDVIETNDSHLTEKLFHDYFKDKRHINSEFFDLTESDISWITDHKYMDLEEFREAIRC